VIKNDSNFHKSLLDVAKYNPTWLELSAWTGHMPFAYWLISVIAPKNFVELGTHKANSYFAFCQAVLEKKLDTKCYAVDTWEGDSQAGIYANEIFRNVNAFNNSRYVGFSTLLKMRFDQALDNFQNSSVDMLHIDGFHTYEAVKHDFESWLPKLTPGALVLFHDTNVRDRDFGVWRFFEELKLIYPNNFEFQHSYGLGILRLDGGEKNYNLNWLESDPNSDIDLRDFFGALGEKLHDFYMLREGYLGDLSSLKAKISELQNELNYSDSKIEGWIQLRSATLNN
jgi:hypothetical protein